MALRTISIFTSDIVWPKPGAFSRFQVICVGGGGGGGSGRRAGSGNRCGGGGGGGGGFNQAVFANADLPATVAITIGQGGAGGVEQSSDDTNGNNGNAGTATTFGAFVSAGGGQAGNAGTAANSLIRASGGSSIFSALVGDAGASANLLTDRHALFTIALAAGSGGGGGGAGTATATGGNGGRTLKADLTGKLVFPDWVILDPGADNDSPTPTGGCGGIGGDFAAGVLGTAGANGGLYGGGGGGGSASNNGFLSGPGGNGADGVCLVLTYDD